MEPSDIRQRAARSALLLAFRGSAVRAIAFLGTLVLARSVTPEEFGILAIALAISQVAIVLADGGLGAALMRGPVPARNVLRAVLGYQLVVTTVLFVVAFPICLASGTVGQVIGIALITVPLSSIRIPSTVILERNLQFGRTVIAELSETVAYYGWALAVVALDGGIWGLAFAPLARTIVGSVVLVVITPTRVLRPLFSWPLVRPVFRFGAYFQGTAILGAARQQGRDVGIGAIAGTQVLGVWSLAFRLLQVPFLLFDSLWKVSYPALARLIESGEDVKNALNRAMSLSSIGGGAMTAAIVASAPAAVPLLFGSEWNESADLLLLTGLGIVISSPISVVAIGYLYAVGRADKVFKFSLIFVSAGLGATFVGLPLMGTSAIGIGWLVQAIVGVTLFARELATQSGANPVRAVFVPDMVAIAGGAAGWLLASSGDPHVALAVLGGLTPLVAVAFATLLFDRETVEVVSRLLRPNRTAQT